MIKYVAFYNLPQFNNEGRTTNLAGISVMDYMKDVYVKCDSVDIYSPSHTVLRSGKFSAKKIVISDGVNFYMPKSAGAKTFVGRIFRNVYTELWLIGKLLFKTKKSDTVICYHSPYVMTAVKIAKRIKRFKLLLEIREIYGDAKKNGEKLRKKEFKFFKSADGFVFATKELEQLINKDNKDYVIAPGVYRSNPMVAEKFNDGRIHLVYAGTLDKIKGGAYVAIELAKRLDSGYCLHILGYGSEKEKEDIKSVIERSESGAEIIFEGEKSGEEFNAFLQKCDVGLSTQNIVGQFNGTSFPSKILTYMCNGLKVFSSDISVVKNSPVGAYVVFYSEQDYENMAETIKGINVKDCADNCEILNNLNRDLIKDFTQMYNGGNL